MRKKLIKNSPVSGFTLIELLLAMFVGTFLVVPLFAITSGIADSSAQQRELNEAQNAGRIGMDQLVHDIQRAAFLASPNTMQDSAACGSVQYAQWRPGLYMYNGAVSIDNDSYFADALVVTGNLTGTWQHHLRLVNGNVLEIRDLTADWQNWQGIPQNDCMPAFHGALAAPFPGVSGVHIVNSTGFRIDLPVTSVQETVLGGGLVECDVTVDVASLPTGLQAEGPCGVGGTGSRSVMVSPSVSVLYRLVPSQTINGMYDLVREMLQVQQAPTSDLASLTPVPQTREVIIRNAVDFQVWFRPALTDGNVPQRVRYMDYSTSSNPMTPDRDSCLLIHNSDDLSDLYAAAGGGMASDCDLVGFSGGNGSITSMRPEWMRSVMVQVSVASTSEDPHLVAQGITDQELYMYDLDNAGVGHARVTTYKTELQLHNFLSREGFELPLSTASWP